MGAAGVLTAIQTGVGLWSSFQQASALKEQGKVEEKLSQQNARLLDLQAEDAVIRGDTAANEVKRRAAYVKGAQVAGYAGQGINPGTGTPASVLGETDQMSGMDALTVKNNAFREAWGYKTEAINDRFKGRMARIAGDTEARNTLLTGGLTAAGDITRGIYLNNRFKNTGVDTPKTTTDSFDRSNSGYRPRNPTEARFDYEYLSKRRGK